VNRRAVIFWGGLVVALLLVGLVSGGRSQTGEPLDPDSTDPLGTRALIIFLDELDGDIVRDLPDDDVSTTLLLADQLEADQRAGLLSWVERGGTLVVTDPGSTFAPRAALPVVDNTGAVTSGDCSIPGLDGLRLEAASFVLYPAETSGESGDGAPLGAGRASELCFGDGRDSYLHETAVGSGRVVALGGALALTNQNLDEADNAVLAARLLLPAETGAANAGVAVLFEPILTAGSRTFGDLIPSGAKWSTWQLLVAFALYVLWRAPRFGRPVPEPQPVELPGSLLVRATGELHRRSGGHGQAAQALRAHLDRRLRRQLRLSPESSTSDVVRAVGERHEAEASAADRVLSAPSVASGDELAALLVDIDHLNRAVLSEELASDIVRDSYTAPGLRRPGEST